MHTHKNLPIPDLTLKNRGSEMIGKKSKNWPIIIGSADPISQLISSTLSFLFSSTVAFKSLSYACSSSAPPRPPPSGLMAGRETGSAGGERYNVQPPLLSPSQTHPTCLLLIGYGKGNINGKEWYQVLILVLKVSWCLKLLSEAFWFKTNVD